MSFFITLYFHTHFAHPWIFWTFGLYVLDNIISILRSRIKMAILNPIGDQMTLVRSSLYFLLKWLDLRPVPDPHPLGDVRLGGWPAYPPSHLQLDKDTRSPPCINLFCPAQYLMHHFHAAGPLFGNPQLR